MKDSCFDRPQCFGTVPEPAPAQDEERALELRAGSAIPCICFIFFLAALCQALRGINVVVFPTAAKQTMSQNQHFVAKRLDT